MAWISKYIRLILNEKIGGIALASNLHLIVESTPKEVQQMLTALSIVLVTAAGIITLLLFWLVLKYNPSE
jgi:ABC-type Co2+ transport system permease subunit